MFCIHVLQYIHPLYRWPEIWPWKGLLTGETKYSATRDLHYANISSFQTPYSNLLQTSSNKKAKDEWTVEVTLGFNLFAKPTKKFSGQILLAFSDYSTLHHCHSTSSSYFRSSSLPSFSLFSSDSLFLIILPLLLMLFFVLVLYGLHLQKKRENQAVIRKSERTSHMESSPLLQKDNHAEDEESDNEDDSSLKKPNLSFSISYGSV
jgi:hypothetical protein